MGIKNRTWYIYYRDREYARHAGDPLLGKVEADTKEDAEIIANDSGMGGVSEVWATKINRQGYGDPDLICRRSR